MHVLVLWAAVAWAGAASVEVMGGMEAPLEAVDRVAERLELSAAQRDQVKGLVAEARRAVAALRQEAEGLEAEARAAYEEGRRGRAERLVRRSARVRAEVVIRGMRTREQVLALLTPDQAARLKQYLAQRRASRAR